MLNSRIFAFRWLHPFELSRLPRIAVPSVGLILFAVLYGLPVLAQKQLPTASDFAALSVKADEARDANRLDDAVALYKRALALRPAWTEGWWSLGTIQYDRNAYSEAARALEKVIALDPTAGTAKVMLGLCEFELGDDASALQHLEDGRRIGVAKDPQLRQVMLYHIGVLQRRRGSFEGAQETFEALCADGVRDDGLMRELGLVALRTPGKHPAADGAPDAEIVAGLGRAECLAAQRKFEEARQEDSDLVKRYPKYPNLHYAYGKFLLEAHDTTAAVEEFKQEINNNPNHVFARLEIAAVKYRVDSAGGLPYAEEAAKLAPQIPLAHYLLGLLLLDTGNAERAVPELEMAQKAFPQEPQVYFALGGAYAREGRKSEAARARATFLRLNKEQAPERSARVYGQEPAGAPFERLGKEQEAAPPR